MKYKRVTKPGTAAPRPAPSGPFPQNLEGYIQVFAKPGGRVKARSKRGWTERKVVGK